MNVHLRLLVFAAGLTSYGLGLLDEYPCIHDEIVERNPYVISAAAQGEPGRTKRQISTNYSSIRITPFLRTDIDPEIASYVNENGILSRSIEVLTSVLMVDSESAEDNFILPPRCNEYTTGINKGRCEHPLPENISYTCGEFGVIPDEFIGNREVCYSQNGSCYLNGANGTGIPNTDYLLFVSAVNTPTCAANRNIAYSSPCIRDGRKKHRPIVGYINICPPMLLGTALKDETIVGLITHEIIHILGFSVSLFDRFVDENGNTYNATMDILGPYGQTTIFRGSKTVEFARSYYSCNSIEGVSFENELATSSHWERRTLNHEIMNGFIADDYQVLSEFTIALLEDSGWYKANYSALYDLNQQKLYWGKGLGCSFLTENCTNSSVYPYLCDVNTNPIMCTPDHLSKGFCSRNWPLMDGCAVALLIDSDSYCRLESSTGPDNGIESFGSNSICVGAFLSMNYNCGVYLTKPPEPFCVSQETYSTNNSLSYILNVNGSSYNCSDNHAIITDINWTLLCPPAEEVALQSSLIIEDEVPALSPFDEIVINDLSRLGIVEFIKPDNRTCLPEFYPFGLSENDQILNNTIDDVTSELINLTDHVYFYGEAIRRTYVADNGIISFENPFNRHTPLPLPQPNNKFVAPYWANVDLTGTGQVFYRQTNDAAIVARSTKEIKSAFPLSQDTYITNVLIVTWYGVGYYRKQTNLINTFQCVIATSKIESFVTFIYIHGAIQWPTGSSSALAGINAGDGVNSITTPGSLTPDIINIAQTSNVGIPGVWIFKVGEAIRINFLSRYVSIVEPLRHVPVRIVSSGGTSNNPITIIVTPSEQSPISAMGSGVDFDSNAFNLTFIPNQMVNEIFNISIICDHLKDGSEYFDVTIATDNPLVHIDNNVASVRINDLIVNFNQSLVAVREDAGTVSLELTVYPTTYEQFEVGISLMDNDAMSGEDYNGTDILVNLLVSMSSKSFTIDIFDDDIIEGDEIFTVQMVSVSQCGISIGNFDSVQVTITDNEGILTSQITEVGGSVNFTCINNVSFDYAWYYNNFTVVDDPDHIAGANTSTLMITNVSAIEWGTYQCIASHNNFSSIAEGTLHISPKGTVITSEDILSTFNSSVNITCNAGGGPNNVYQWRKQGELISNNAQLHFQSVRGSDGGVYQCTVTNAAGSGTASTHLYVVPYNVMISEAIVNGTIIYTCYSDGGPGNLYHWMRQGGGSFTISQQLVFTMKVQSNKGTYECTVDNDAGRKTVSITFSDGPAISRLSGMQTVTLESRFVLLCNATGNPSPQITWRKNGIAYTDSERVYITVQSLSGFAVSSLTVSSAIYSDGGLYECVAVNVLGIDSDNITVLVAGQECIGLASNIEGSEIINCTSGITRFGYQGDTCVIIYNNTLGQVKEIWSCQENGEWINTSILVLHSETNLSQVANIMDTINFICNITGSPISSIKIGWTFMLPTHDDRIEINTVTNDNYVVSNLTIKLIQPSDAGLYRCTASLEGIAGNISFKLIVAASTECKPDIDEEWGIQWQLTSAGSVAEQQCPNGSGLAYRLCLPNTTWDMVINDTECQSDKLEMLFSLLSDISGNSSNLINNIGEIEAISKDISAFTNVTTGISPNELSVANDIISVLTEKSYRREPSRCMV